MYEAEEHEVPVPAVFQACGNEGIFSIAYPLLADDGTSRLKQGVEGSVFAPDRDFPTVQALEPTLLRSGLNGLDELGERGELREEASPQLRPGPSALSDNRAELCVSGSVQESIVMFERSEENTSELQSLMRISYAV